MFEKLKGEMARVRARVRPTSEFIGLRELSQTDHPLLTEGKFSVFYNPEVNSCRDFRYSLDLDGFCVISK